jgi:hypothetical protein
VGSVGGVVAACEGSTGVTVVTATTGTSIVPLCSFFC